MNIELANMDTLSDHDKWKNWQDGLAEIHEGAQNEGAHEGHLLGELRKGVDVTDKVFGLADDLWGEHDVSDDLLIHTFPFGGVVGSRYLMAQDRVLRDKSGNKGMQGGYLKKSGLFVVHNNDLVAEWLNEREIPEGSPFLSAREQAVSRIAPDSLKEAIRLVRSARELRSQTL